MAQKTHVVLVDDIDGKEIAQGGETVQFGIDGVVYEIDLNDKNAAKLREALRFYIDHSRRVGGRRQTSRSTRNDLQKIREWARANGHKVSDRGRVAQDIQEAYAAAHSA